MNWLNPRNVGMAAAAVGVGVGAVAMYMRARNAPPPARQQLQQQLQHLTPTQRLARENVMSLIRLRGAAQAAPGATGVDVVVHGTFAHGADWARPDSSFSTRMRNARNAVATSFQWSGGPLEADRQTAGNQLAPFLRDTQRPMIAGNRRTNVITHSHGGNVLGHALSNNNVRIDNAVLLAAPMMSQGGNPNVSWTAQGANRVRNAIVALSAPDDAIQTVGAQANEWRQGRYISSGRQFSRPDSVTPQINLTVTQPQGPLATVRDLALGAARLNARMDGNNRATMAALGTAAAAEAARRVQAHGGMHSDRVGNLISQGLQVIESAPGRALMMAQRINNWGVAHTQPMSGHVHLP